MADSTAAGLSRELTEVQRRAIVELIRVFPVIDELGARFAKAGHELYLVGGSVRDALLGRLGDDLDFATSATPDETLAALKGWGLSVQPFKAGPDFIDPSHHTAICGRASRNLDTWMCDGATVAEIFERSARDADISTCRGATSPSTRWPCRYPGTSSPTRTAA